MIEKKKVGRPRKSATANDVLRLAERLSEKERKKLLRYGARIPEGTADLDDPGDSIWGLRCKHCNGVALRFLGTKWNGQPVPPAGMKLSELSWTQDAIEPDPNNPNCQHCGAGPSLGVGGGILPPHAPHFGIVMIREHEEAMQAAYGPEEQARVRAQLAAMHGDLQGSSHTFTTRETTIGQHIDRVAQTGTVGIEGTAAAQQVGPGGAPAGRTAAVMESVADQGGLNDATAGGFKPLGHGTGSAE